MKDNPLVSVIVPLYNYSMFIGDCIKSIQNQDYINWELIIVDDCSTDNSYEFAKSFECKNIKVIKIDINSGYSTAKNEGIIISQGELITTLDADDLFTRDSVSCRVRELITKEPPFVHGKAIVIGGGISLEGCYNLNLCKVRRGKANIHAQTVMMERWVYKKFGLYDEEMRSRADKEMWRRLFGKKSDKISRIEKIFLNKDVAYYRRHNKSMMRKRQSKPKVQDRLAKQLEKQYNMRKKSINKDNTRFLER